MSFGLTVFASLLLVFACATRPPVPSPEQRSQLGNLGVTAIASVPNVDFHTYARGWISGAAKGGGQGLITGLVDSLVEASRNPPTGPYAEPAMLITVVLLTTTQVFVSGVMGSLEAVPKQTADEAEQALQEAIGGVDLADRLAGDIVDAAARRPDLRHPSLAYLGVAAPSTEALLPQWANRGVDTVIEVQVTEAGFHGGRGARPEVSFYMNARIRLVATRENRMSFTRDFRFLSRVHPVTDWFADRAQLLAATFAEAVQVLAERITDELFVVTRFPFDSGYWALPGQPEFGACWFRPLYPELKYTSLWDAVRNRQPGVRISYTPVESLQPWLAWEGFPRPRDRQPANDALLQRISEVTYDLKIWEAIQDYPASLVVDLTGLGEPEYRPTTSLKERTTYFWTFRARYLLDGEPRVSRWAFSNIPSNLPAEYPARPAGGNCDLDAIPSTNYYRFRTP